MLLCYCLCWFPSVSPFGPIPVFRPIPALYANSTDFYAEFTHLFLPHILTAHAIPHG